MRYFINGTGGWLSTSGDVDILGFIPDGYHEVTETEFNEASGTILVELPQGQPAEQNS